MCLKQPIKTLWRHHTAFLFFMALMAVQLLSVYVDSGTKYLRVNVLYVFLLIFAYILFNTILRAKFNRLAERASFHGSWKSFEKPLANAIDALVIIFPFIYFASAGYVPFVRMMYINDYYQASGLRQVFFEDLPTTMNYAGEYFLRGIAPVWLVYSYLNKRKLFYVMLALTSAQALGVITKASIVILLFPLIVVQLGRKDWRHVILTGALISLMLALNVTVLHRTVLDQLAKNAAEQSIKKKQERKKEIIEDSQVTRYLQSHLENSETNQKIIEEYKSVEIVAQGIWTRLFAVNGLIVTEWLETFPADKGFQHGCGYRWYAALKGCEFVKLPDMVWMKYYADLHKEYGLVGTVSAPHYINAYANFGEDGVLFSAIGMAILLVLLAAIFTDPVQNIAFNGSFLALALQTPLTSMMNSNGWGLTIIMVMVFFPRKNQAMPLIR